MDDSEDIPYEELFNKPDVPFQNNDMNLDNLVKRVLKSKPQGNEEEIQSDIIDGSYEIYFKYNSVNLVIGKRGSGKTFMVMKEVLKLAYQMKFWDEAGVRIYDKPRYTQVIYITDKLRDDTCERIKKHIEEETNMEFAWEKTENALGIIEDISRIKAFLANPTQAPEDLQTEETIKKCRQVLHIHPKTPDDAPLPHTLIIFDDCIGLFNKYSPLSKKLFENRQSRITYFLLLQDVQGINPSMKANVDSLVFFGGFPKHKWNSLMYQMPAIWDMYTFDTGYHELKSIDFVLFDYIDNYIWHKKRNGGFELMYPIPLTPYGIQLYRKEG